MGLTLFLKILGELLDPELMNKKDSLLKASRANREDDLHHRPHNKKLIKLSSLFGPLSATPLLLQKDSIVQAFQLRP